MSKPFGSVLHLARRFFGSLSPRPPAPADVEWAEGLLGPGEVALWRTMPVADRRHSLVVAQQVALLLGAEATRPVLAAALMHDVGKVDAGLGTFARVGVTVLALVVGRDRLAAGQGRAGRYLRHDAIGAGMLARAGADPVTVTWAREHHLPAERMSLPVAVAAALKAADDD